MVWLMPLRACVHVTHGTWLNDSFRVMCQVRVKGHVSSCEENGKVGGSFPTLINSVVRQEKGGRKKNKREGKRKKKEKKKRK